MSPSAAPLSALLLVLAANAGLAAPSATDDRIAVDQFGYRSGDRKIAVVSEPQQGYDAPAPLTRGAVLEIRGWTDDVPVFTGAPAPWRAGAVHAQSGDRAWRLDFSALAAPGAYYVHDSANDISSGRIDVRDDVFVEVMKHALRSFYYQRCGVAKDAAHALPSWADGSCHVAGVQQDLDARSVLDTGPATSRDLSGGWHDAGDYNKYVNYADNTVHDLVAAFEEHPDAFGDDLGIPESGNGRADILDELQVEIEWMLKMQLPDGSVLHKIQATDFSAASPPSADATQRRHAPATASATISACAAWAHAALVFGAQSDPASLALAARLDAAALAAWSWLEANPGRIGTIYDNAGFQGAASEDDAEWQRTNMTCAAVYLFCRTGDIRFRDHVDATYANAHLMQWGYAYPFESELQDGLLHYARCAGATVPVVQAIRAAYLDSVGGPDNWDAIRNDDDAYRAFLADGDYTWGSSRTKANKGLMFLQCIHHGLAPARDAEFEDAASGYLHYLHGVNPNGLVYVSAMEPHGAERSCQEFYHSWFGDGTPWDNAATSLHGPPPGFVPGGVNPSFRPDPSYAGPPLVPPLNQPIQKAYRDWNTSWPENSWEITENAIGYQASYVRLLAHFVTRAAIPPLSLADPVDASGCTGGSVTLAVTASGGSPPLALQWRHDGLDVPGATNDTILLSPLTPGDAGLYDAVVRDAAGDSVTSSRATVTVGAPPGSPGGSLRARRGGPDVALAWADVADATGYDAARCDASGLRPCAPLTFASVTAPAAADVAPPERVVWYVVGATNACGRTP